MESPRRSTILGLTKEELEQQIRHAEQNIREYKNGIENLNDRIDEQRQIINELILPGRVYETPLYQSIYGTNRLGLQFKEGDILERYQDSIRQNRALIGSANNTIGLERARLTNRQYDLEELTRNKPSKSAAKCKQTGGRKNTRKNKRKRTKKFRKSRKSRKY